jgi:hypothetical protein
LATPRCDFQIQKFETTVGHSASYKTFFYSSSMTVGTNKLERLSPTKFSPCWSNIC